MNDKLTWEKVSGILVKQKRNSLSSISYTESLQGTKFKLVHLSFDFQGEEIIIARHVYIFVYTCICL